MIRLVVKTVILAFVITGCSLKDSVIKPQDTVAPDKEVKSTTKEQALIQSISPYIGKKDGGDCSGFVSLINSKNNNLFFDPNALNSYYSDSRKSKAIYNLYKDKNAIKTKITPKKGDLVFFGDKAISKTKTPEKITHIGIVYDVKSDNTVEFVHNTRGRNEIWSINLSKPTIAKIDDRVVNSYFKRCGKTVNANCLAPAYFRCFGEVKAENMSLADRQ